MIKPDYRVIAVDETHCWDESITAITGRIAGVYVVNFAELHHICSLSGSYEARFLRNITERYIREPDGYEAGEPIWPDDMDPDDLARSQALVAAWNGPFYGLANENAGEEWAYFDERSLDASKGSKIDMEAAGWADEDSFDGWTDEQRQAYRKGGDDAAFDAALEYERNGEEWEENAPWK